MAYSDCLSINKDAVKMTLLKTHMSCKKRPDLKIKILLKNYFSFHFCNQFQYFMLKCSIVKFLFFPQQSNFQTLKQTAVVVFLIVEGCTVAHNCLHPLHWNFGACSCFISNHIPHLPYLHIFILTALMLFMVI